MIKIATSAKITHESVKQHLSSSIEGQPTDFSDETLARMADLARVRKIYKLSAPAVTKARKNALENLPVINGDRGTMEHDRKEIEVNILGLMALRGAT